LFRKEEDGAVLSSAAKQGIIAQRNGMSEAEAAAHVGVTQVELHQWKKNKTYRAALAAGLAAGVYSPFVDVEAVAAEIRGEDFIVSDRL